MKNTTLCLALLGMAGSAIAQTSVTVYGSIDGTVRHVTNADAEGNGRTVVGSNGWSRANRLGFKGTEQLGNGLEAHFNLEAGFNNGTGSLDVPNTLFNRTASVGIGGTFGTLDVGRQYTVAFRTATQYDPFGLRFPGITYFMPSTAGIRVNNDIQYSGTFGPLTLRAEHAFGEHAGSDSNGSMSAVGASYNFGSLLVGGAYTERKPLVGTQYFDNEHYTVGAAYTIDKWKIALGHAKEEQDGAVQAVDTTYQWAGVGYNFTPVLNVTGALYRNKVEGGLASGRKDLFIVAGFYSLSKRTSLHLEIDRTEFKDGLVASRAQKNQTGLSLGVNHLF